MSSNTRPGADFSVSDLAATFAHSLNNLLGLVHAGHSHLESESHDGALRARAALQRVCSEGNVVSASLSVLALDLAKVEAIRTGGRFDWDAHEWGLLEDALSDIAGVTYAGPFPAPALRATISAPLLRSIVICAIAQLRKEIGARRGIRVSLDITPERSRKSFVASFKMLPEPPGRDRPAEEAPPLTSPVRKLPHSLLALRHFATVAGLLEARIVLQQGHSISLDARVHPADQ